MAGPRRGPEAVPTSARPTRPRPTHRSGCTVAIPLCHPLPLTKCQVTIGKLDDARVVIHTEAATDAKTGVEMEALSAASGAALTLYDMCKSVTKGIIIERIRLLEKSGGKSEFQAD